MRDICAARDDAQSHLYSNGRCSLCGKALPVPERPMYDQVREQFINGEITLHEFLVWVITHSTDLTRLNLIDAMTFAAETMKHE